MKVIYKSQGKIFLSAIAAVACWAGSAKAQNLNARELLARCYAHVTQTDLLPSNAAIAAVNGGEDPITACLNIFNKGKFTAAGNTKIGSVSDKEAVSVLKTFHKLHTSWFSQKDFSAIGGGLALQGNKDLYDVEEPAFFFTRALFRPSTEVKSVLTLGSSLKAIRSNPNPGKGAASNTVPTSEINYIWTSMIHPHVGDLHGITPVGEQPMNYVVKQPPPAADQTGTFKAHEHFGGGVLGTQVYLMKNIVPPTLQYRANGGDSMPRKYARSVFSDLLCRDLPVIRTEDAVPYVVPSSGIAFRQSSGCVRCHASMDRAAAVTRNFTIFARGRNAGEMRSIGFELFTLNTPNLAAEAAWPTAPDANYWRRPPNGVLYYRSHNGTLVDTPVANLSALGSEIAKNDDFYMCIAKRYYNYFIGVDVNVGDVSNPSDGIYLSAKDQYHRERVISLGAALKQSQSVPSLIESILRSADYKLKNFGHLKTKQ